MLKWIAATFCLLVLSAIPLAAQPSAYHFVDNDCTFTPPADHRVRCGTLIVPEDRSRPMGNQVRIAVAVFPARDPNPQPDPIFYLDGGPGASTLHNWGSSFDVSFSAFNQTRDVVLLDYRGAGTSVPSLYCTEVSDYLRQIFSQQSAQDDQNGLGYTSALDRCHARLVDDEHLDLSMFRGAVIAQDVADLRAALGYDEINLFGGSYGTRLALIMLRDHPAGIRSVLLDGVYPPQVDRSAGSVLNANRAFEELFAACTHSVACSQRFPNLRAEFYRTATQLNQNPAKVRINTAYTQNGSDLTLTGNTFISYIFNALYSTWLIPSLPLIIDQVANGNYTQMSQVASDKFYTDSTMSLGLYLSIECSDEMPFNTLKATVDAEESVPLGAFYLRSMSATNSNAPDGCTAWGTPNPDPIENEPVASNVPVLIFNGEFDPITPPSWGELAAQTLPNSRVITFPGVGHGASFSGSACAVEIAAAFFSNPNAPSDASCLGNTPVHWVTLDLSTSLLAVEAKIDATDNWYSTYKQSNLYWNTERWSANDYFGTLVITDYQPVAFPKVDQSWFDHLFGNWGKYVLQKQCQRGSYSLYEFSVISSNDTIYIVRYWVDRSSPDKIRDMVLSLAQSDLIDLASNSLKLVPELPNC